MGAFIIHNDTVINTGDYDFTDIYIAEGVVVSFTGNSPVTFRCKGSVIIDGEIQLNGSNGGDATSNLTSALAGSGNGGGFSGGLGIAGTLSSSNGQKGNGPGAGPGGTFFNGAGNGAGYGSIGSGCGISSSNMYGDYMLNGVRGGSGGGSGAVKNGYSSGAGGGGGGSLSITSCNPIIIGSNGGIHVDGGRGGNGFQRGSGGGGGSGGSIYLTAKLVVNKGQITANGGAGGISPLDNSPCMQGGNGGTGRIRIDYSEISNSGIIAPSFYPTILFTAGIRRVVDAKCAGTSTGFIRARSHGGERPYSFKWSNGSHSNELVNVPAGIYTVTISDATGCSVTESAEVHEPSPMTSSAIAYPPSCDNANNSIVIYNVKGGTPYPYENSIATTQWSNSTANGLLFTFDLKSKLSLKKINLLLNQTGNQHIEVYYYHGDGSSLVNNYASWTLVANETFNYPTTEDEIPIDLTSLHQLDTGKHTLYVYSYNSELLGVSSSILGNTFNFDHQLIIYAGMARGLSTNPFATSSSGIMNLSGRITYEIESPNGEKYIYGSNPTEPAIKTGLTPGQYNTVITDVMGCSSTARFAIQPPTALSINPLDIVTPRCHNSTDGEIAIELNAGNISSYAVTPPAFYNPREGVFLQIDNPFDIQLNGIEVYSDTSVTADIYLKRGGYAGFENDITAWILIGSSLTASPDPTGKLTFNLPLPAQLDNDSWSICVRASAGKINVLRTRNNFINSPLLHLNSTAFYSTAPFIQSSNVPVTYFSGTLLYSTPTGHLNSIWSNGMSGTSITGLPGGTYTVTVNYGQQCSSTKVISLTAPSPIQAGVVTTPETDHHADGSIQLNATGGTPPYYIQWPVSGITGNQLDQLSSGDYPVFIADANGCIFRDTIRLQRFETPINQEGWLTIVPNPGHGFIKVGEEVKGMEACTLSVFDVLGRLVIQDSTSISSLMTNGLDIHHLIDANYIIQVRDEDQVYQARAIIIH